MGSGRLRVVIPNPKRSRLKKKLFKRINEKKLQETSDGYSGMRIVEVKQIRINILHFIVGPDSWF